MCLGTCPVPLETKRHGRWDIQMSRDLHLAGYYLNPSYHHRYNLGFDDELLKALRNVINRLERDPTHAALAINPVLDWLQDRDNQEDPLLHQPGDPPRPFRIIADEAGISDAERWADENIGSPQGNVQEQAALDEESQNPARDSDAEFERLMQGPGYGRSRRTQSQSGKEKTFYTAKRPSTTVRSGNSKKSMTSMDPLD
ncbi:hypothetical protein ACMD2_18749 [Ananas comosus]|uniref:Uncharacterized protein n=1 Tax=Ananas comosus TaxID=4615 RepID=A0A199UU44_ANACO|nr:hypothetical protein ACMD2_18749 [Ananas comosus]